MNYETMGRALRYALKQIKKFSKIYGPLGVLEII